MRLKDMVVIVTGGGFGIGKEYRKPFEQVDVEEWDRVMSVTLRGMFLCSKVVVPHMKAQGKGKIINIASTAAYRGLPNVKY